MMEHRYIVWRLPGEGGLRCEICGDEMLTHDELEAARSASERLPSIIEHPIREHMSREHASLLDGDLTILIEPEETPFAGVEFPDEAITQIRASDKEAPPRYPDEQDEAS